MIAQKQFLQRKQSKRVTGILASFPDIGKTIEQYVQERSVGADALAADGSFNI